MHLQKTGTGNPTVQDLHGHADVKTARIYTHVMQKPGMGVKSPSDLRRMRDARENFRFHTPADIT